MPTLTIDLSAEGEAGIQQYLDARGVDMGSLTIKGMEAHLKDMANLGFTLVERQAQEVGAGRSLAAINSKGEIVSRPPLLPIERRETAALKEFLA